MIDTWLPRRPQRFVFAATMIVCLALVVLTASAYRAIREWRLSSAMLVEEWAQGAADLVSMAITRDMTGAQRLLASGGFGENTGSPYTDGTQDVASAFARYPYPEAFFVWQPNHAAAGTFTVYHRADRSPAWRGGSVSASLYPVVPTHDSPAASVLQARIAKDAAARRQDGVFEIPIGDQLYQVVIRLEYADSYRERLRRAVGFMVNLAWVRQAYFAEITGQVAPIVGRGIAMDIQIVDDTGAPVAGQPVTSGVVRPFPLLFAEPLQVGSPALRPWAIRVSAGRSAATTWMARGPGFTLLVVAIAALALAASVIMTTRAVAASAALSEMRSNFVSTVTHELKTPLAAIQAIGATFVRGRVLEGPRVAEYAQMLLVETKRLTRLVDNLLAYSRVTDVTEAYSFEPTAAAELVDDALHGFRFQIADGRFEVDVDVPADLPLVLADRTALCFAIDNLIDNALRHAGENRWLGVSAWSDGTSVRIEVRDRGAGIPPDEIATVQRRFVRGRRAKAAGSGLGLAIVSRIVADHGGTFQLENVAGGGTVARVCLKAV